MAKKRVHRPEGSRPVAQPEVRPSASRPGPSPVAGVSLRGRFEAASRPILLRMQALPAFLIPVALGILLFLGLTLNAAWSGVLLIIIALFLSWLTAVSWPGITTPQPDHPRCREHRRARPGRAEDPGSALTYPGGAASSGSPGSLGIAPP